eukprot:14480446-Ditylum_brightwellii.AAC.1
MDDDDDKQEFLLFPDETIGLATLIELWNWPVPRRSQQISHNLLTPMTAILVGHVSSVVWVIAKSL